MLIYLVLYLIKLMNYTVIYLTKLQFNFRHGADEMALSGVIPCIVKLLSDPTEKVRETAMTTLAEIYRHVGDRLRIDLQRKHNVPQPK